MFSALYYFEIGVPLPLIKRECVKSKYDNNKKRTTKRLDNKTYTPGMMYHKYFTLAMNQVPTFHFIFKMVIVGIANFPLETSHFFRSELSK